MNPDPAGHPAWVAYRNLLRSAFSAAGGSDAARAALVAAIVHRVEPRVSLASFGLDQGEIDVPAIPVELLVPELPGLVLEHLLDPNVRRRTGVHHTPPAVAAALTEIALGARDPAAGVPTVCDPAAGGGVFLLAAARALRRRGADVATVLSSLFGADLDPLAAATTQAAIACWAIGEGAGPDETTPDGHIVAADGLDGDLSVWPVAAREGFDVVIGNPPFLNQLGRTTVRRPIDRTRLRARFGDAASGYSDTAGLFLMAAMGLARTGGRVVMIQPESLLAARDGRPVRQAVEAAGGLTDLWVAGERVFAAGARVCAPALTVGHRSVSVRRFRGADFEPLSSVESVGVGAGSWATLALAAYSVPAVTLPADTGTLADLATATAGFRDQFYGLVPHVVDGSPDQRAGQAPLVTVGSIEPLWCRWGTAPARFAGRDWTRPLVDLTSLTDDPALHRWVTDRLVPKVLVATQTRVIEAVIDIGGELVPSVPVIAIASDPADLWAIAAVLLSPPVSAWALARTAGTALASDHVKLSARQVLAVPLPVDRDRWRAAASALATGTERSPLRFGAAMCEAYGLGADDPVLRWWIDRLGTWRGQPSGR